MLFPKLALEPNDPQALLAWALATAWAAGRAPVTPM
jgi:hypothetical protein